MLLFEYTPQKGALSTKRTNNAWLIIKNIALIMKYQSACKPGSVW